MYHIVVDVSLISSASLQRRDERAQILKIILPRFRELAVFLFKYISLTS